MGTERVTGLDQLRGICAGSIMIMHYTHFAGTEHTASAYLGRMGFYGVCIFYVLSGLALYLVYNSSIRNNFKSIGSFFLKRIFRIYPLLWLVILYNVLRALYMQEALPATGDLFMNLTGLFGFVAWDHYIGTGVWSIGNELVFYSLFPLIILLLNKRPLLAHSGYLLSLASFLYFTFFRLGDPDSFWHFYTNPLNHLFYFYSGIMLGHFFSSRKLFDKKWLYVMIASAAAAFLIYPLTGPASLVVSGLHRIFFTLLGIIFCLYFLFSSIGVMERFFSVTGEISYAIYLLHPAVISTLSIFWFRLFGNDQQSMLFLIAACIIFTWIISYISYRYFEMPVMRYGKKLGNKLFYKDTLSNV